MAQPDNNDTLLKAYAKETGFTDERCKNLLRNEARILSDKIQKGYRPGHWTHKQVILLKYVDVNKMVPHSILEPLLDHADIDETLRETEGKAESTEEEIRAKKRARREQKEKEEPEKSEAESKSILNTNEDYRRDEKLLNSNDIEINGLIPRRKVLDLTIRILVSSSPIKEVFNVFDEGVQNDIFRLAHLVLSVAMKVELRAQLKPDEAKKLLTEKEYAVLDIYQNALKSADRKNIIESLNMFIKWMRPRLGLERQLL